MSQRLFKSAENTVKDWEEERRQEMYRVLARYVKALTEMMVYETEKTMLDIASKSPNPDAVFLAAMSYKD